MLKRWRRAHCARRGCRTAIFVLRVRRHVVDGLPAREIRAAVAGKRGRRTRATDSRHQSGALFGIFAKMQFKYPFYS